MDSFSGRTVLVTGGTLGISFGIATQLCFLVPLGAVVAMPAAVAGSTLLARSLLDHAPQDAAAGRECRKMGADHRA